jgi:uncharacterized protein YjiS (DUF1127 family)
MPTFGTTFQTKARLGVPRQSWWLGLALAISAIERIEHSWAKRESRRALLRFSDYQLKDIGISRADAFREGSRPFWR